jgi:hypothetical protein
MRKTVAKQIRKLVNPENPASRRVYRRLKKAYNTLPHNKRGQFLKILGLSFSKQDEKSDSSN